MEINTLYLQAKALLPRLIELRRHLHSIPELACEEFQTAWTIEQELDKMHIPHKRVGATGIIAYIRGELPDNQRIIALRADIDALPIQEENDVSYRSKTDGVMHACGHDAHTTCLLGAAQMLADARESFAGEIRLFFQAGEEVGKGAFDFIEEGYLTGVQRVFGLHTAHEIPSGTISLTPGLNNAAVDHFHIHVQGHAAHVSTPQLGSDALYIASQIVVAVQGLVTRCTSPIEPTIIGIGKLSSGTTYNAVAEDAEMEGTTRTITPEMRDQLRTQITRVAESIAEAYGGRATVIWTGICSALYNNADVCSEASAVCSCALSDNRFINNRPFSLGGDNFAEFLNEVPGAYAYLGSGDCNRPETCHPAHNGHFNIDESILSSGAALYASYAYWWMTHK